MQIRILGTRGKIEAKTRLHTKHSGILIDDKILIDVGEKEFLKSHPQYIFFTHLHPDHAWFVESQEFFDAKIPVYVPEENYLIKEKRIINAPVQIENYTITPVPTIHSIKVKSQGYVVEKNNKRIFYSGDMIWIEKKYYPLLKDLDLVITEGSFIRKGGAIRRAHDQIFGHNGIPDLINYFKKFTNHIVLTHFGTWFMEDMQEAKKKIHQFETEKLKIDVAYDGKEYVV